MIRSGRDALYKPARLADKRKAGGFVENTFFKGNSL